MAAVCGFPRPSAPSIALFSSAISLSLFSGGLGVGGSNPLAPTKSEAMQVAEIGRFSREDVHPQWVAVDALFCGENSGGHASRPRRPQVADLELLGKFATRSREAS